MTGPRLLIRTPSRLHFGLLGWGPGSRRQFGGLGLMIDSPAIELTVEPGAIEVVQGPLADRVERIIEVLRERLPDLGIHPPPGRDPRLACTARARRAGRRDAAQPGGRVGHLETCRLPRPLGRSNWPDSRVGATAPASVCTASGTAGSSSTAAGRRRARSRHS